MKKYQVQAQNIESKIAYLELIDWVRDTYSTRVLSAEHVEEFLLHLSDSGQYCGNTINRYIEYYRNAGLTTEF
jgi:hypothetical protein